MNVILISTRCICGPLLDSVNHIKLYFKTDVLALAELKAFEHCNIPFFSNLFYAVSVLFPGEYQ